MINKKTGHGRHEGGHELFKLDPPTQDGGHAPRKLTQHQKNVLRHGRELLSLGYSIVPLGRGNNGKAPVEVVAGKPMRWEKYIEGPMSKGKLEWAFRNFDVTGLGIISGPCSGLKDSEGNRRSLLQIIDIDQKNDELPDTLGRYRELVERDCPGLWGRLVIEETQSGGAHIYVQTQCAEPKQNLACNERGGPIIELLGFREGGKDGKPSASYAAAYPTKGYRIVQGDMSKTPLVSNNEFKALIDNARALNRKPEEAPKPDAHRGGMQANRTQDGAKGAVITEKFLAYVKNTLIPNALSQFRKTQGEEKHYRLRNGSFIIGRLVGGGMIDYETAHGLIKAEIDRRPDLKSYRGAYITAQRCLREGMTDPFTYEEKLGEYQAWIDKNVRSRKEHEEDDTYIIRNKAVQNPLTGQWERPQEYLSDIGIVQKILENPDGFGRVLFQSPTGSGKTKVFNEAFSKLAKQGKKCIILLPYTTLPYQVAKEYGEIYGVVAITGTSTDEEVKEAKSSNLIAVTYDSLSKVADSASEIHYAAIDEAHNIIDQFAVGFRRVPILRMMKTLESVKNVALITATPSPLFKEMGFTTIKVRREEEPDVRASIYTYDKGSASDVLLQVLAAHDFENERAIVKLNDKSEIRAVQKAVSAMGILREGQTGGVYNPEDPEELERNETFTSIRDKGRIPDKVRLVLTTSKLNDGVNIKNDDITLMVDMHERSPRDGVQFPARARDVGMTHHKVKTLRVIYIRAASDKPSSGFDRVRAYRTITRTAKRLAETANEQNEALSSPEFDTIGRLVAPPTFCMQKANGEIVPDKLAIAHEVERIHMERMNIDDFQREVSEIAPYIKFEGRQHVNTVRNEAREKAKSLIKEEKERAFADGLKLFSENMKAFLAVVYMFTKDIGLKGQIETFLGARPTLSPELELFKDEYAHLFRFENVVRIGKCFIKLLAFGFTQEEAIHLVAQDGFVSRETFRRFLNRLTVQRLLLLDEVRMSRYLNHEMRHQLRHIKLYLKRIRKLGRTATAAQIHTAMNKGVKCIGQRLAPQKCADFIQYAFEHSKRRVGKDRRLTYTIGQELTLTGIIDEYGISGDAYAVRFLNTAETYLKSLDSGRHTVDKSFMSFNLHGLSTPASPENPKKTALTSSERGFFNSPDNPENFKKNQEFGLKTPPEMLYDGFCHQCGF